MLIPIGLDLKVRAALGTVLWMGVWWVGLPVDPAITAFLPVVVNAMFSLTGMDEIISSYAAELVFLLAGANLITIAWERTGVDKRVASMMLSLVGTSVKQQIAVWFLAATLLSAFLPNTVVAAILCSIAMSMLKFVNEGDLKKSRVAPLVLLAIVWGANNGGLMTPLGGAMNLVTVAYIEELTGAEFINDNDRQGFRFEVSLRPDSIVKLNYFEIFGPDKQKFKQEISAVFGDTISTPVGQMIIRPTLYMSPDYYEKAPIRVTKGNLGVVTQFYQHEVKSFVANKQASIITISMKSSVPKKAEDVINTLIAVYEKDAIDDKRGIAESTGQFIDNRLEIISEELSEVDRNIEKFKKDNKIYDIVSEAEQTITESAQYKTDGLSLENQIRMTEFLKEYLLDPTKTNELIPGTLSINSPAIR